MLWYWVRTGSTVVGLGHHVIQHFSDCWFPAGRSSRVSCVTLLSCIDIQYVVDGHLSDFFDISANSSWRDFYSLLSGRISGLIGQIVPHTHTRAHTHAQPFSSLACDGLESRLLLDETT